MTTLIPNDKFSRLASDEQIGRTVQALQENNISPLVTDTGDEARRRVLDLLPERAEIFTASSLTLETIGLAAEIEASPRFRAIRPQLMSLRNQEKKREMRKVGASPDIVIGSVHAVTEQGQILIASGSGSQLASYVYGAETVIWVVGTQKLVGNLDEGLQRIQEYSYPREDTLRREIYGWGSTLGKILIIHREIAPGRITVVLVKENLGF